MSHESVDARNTGDHKGRHYEARLDSTALQRQG